MSVVFFPNFVLFVIEISVTNSADLDLTPHNAASDLGLHCLPMSHKREARLICVKFHIYSTFM